MQTTDMPTDAVAHWDDFYRTRRTSPSGRPTGALETRATSLPPGRALDLGSSNGDDVLWLAARGWDALGLDISSVAVIRAAGRAAELGLPGARFEACDLATAMPDGPFDLVTALYLLSPVAGFPRADILRRAAATVAPGGHILSVAHAAPPPWSEHRHSDTSFPTVEEDLAALAPGGADWDVLEARVIERPGKGPDGQEAMLQDTVVFLRRR
ncbi:class I SAM-dependent methyltransferase [Wenxinia marina]|uniref:Methylase involved in ubiquinone/menaquinone biosynthesis n=1 Tax=Wenxinia marina DSM 24838 TaxID=1123501 RepID=A0A0D0PED3_9RHOB|nr:class I SAM-dependent methyltransferase [Wenxinia marina]KIQ69751.1 Methylase involved in ubiquinone/menaquinone biosynthesis [Wenxinia marina DSM 24838]GGL60871.1 16S RNA G1207 methylase RsmC [Wenxinia marina]